MQKISEKNCVLAGLIITGIVFFILAFTTEIPEGGADNFAHFNIARWAFRYPYLFLDHWGKPVFTILSAPFSQFGFPAVRILNSVLGLLTAWYTWKLSRLFGFQNSWFSVIVVIFTPIYFVMMSTGMTEIIFSFILIVSVYLFFKEKYLLSAIVVSFIFLARTEGLAFLLIFLIGLVLRKKYKIIPFLATGFLIFSIIGWVFHYHDFFWLINERPYAKGGSSVYGKGKWYHFIEVMPNYFGETIQILLVVGSIVLIVEWIRGRAKFNNNSFLQIIFILGAFWGYFFIHSYLWWLGETSAGLQRVMAGVSPMIGLIALFGIEKLFTLIPWKELRTGMLAVLSVLLIYHATQFYYQSVNYDLSAEIQSRVTKWLKESGSLKHKLVMHNPYFAFSTELDAWDNNVVQYGFSNNDEPENGLADSTIFIWDAHFSANEGRLSLEKIMDSPNFEVVKLFEPLVPFKVLGDNDYKIIIFRKIANSGTDNKANLQEFKKAQIEKGIYFSEIYDCEIPFQAEYLEKQRILSPVDTANHLFDLSGVDFSPVFHVPVEKIDRTKENVFNIAADIMRSDSIGVNRLLMVFSVEEGNKAVHYVTADICEQTPQTNVWYKTQFTFNVPGNLENGTMLKSYIWNIDKKAVLLDNYKLEISKQTEN